MVLQSMFELVLCVCVCVCAGIFGMCSSSRACRRWAGIQSRLGTKADRRIELAFGHAADPAGPPRFNRGHTEVHPNFPRKWKLDVNRFSGGNWGKTGWPEGFVGINCSTIHYWYSCANSHDCPWESNSFTQPFYRRSFSPPQKSSVQRC